MTTTPKKTVYAGPPTDGAGTPPGVLRGRALGGDTPLGNRATPIQTMYGTVVRAALQPATRLGPVPRERRRILAQALRDAIHPDEIALLLRTIIVTGRCPGDVSIDPDTGLPRNPAVLSGDAQTFVPADTAERLVALKLYLERAHGTPGDQVAIEDALRRAQEAMLARPDYSALDDEELATARRLKAKALGKARRALPNDEPDDEPDEPATPAPDEPAP